LLYDDDDDGDDDDDNDDDDDDDYDCLLASARVCLSFLYGSRFTQGQEIRIQKTFTTPREVTWH